MVYLLEQGFGILNFYWWVGVKSVGLGVFLVQSGRFLVVQNFILFEFCLLYLNLAPHLDIWAPNLWILAPIFGFFAPRS